MANVQQQIQDLAQVVDMYTQEGNVEEARAAQATLDALLEQTGRTKKMDMSSLGRRDPPGVDMRSGGFVPQGVSLTIPSAPNGNAEDTGWFLDDNESEDNFSRLPPGEQNLEMSVRGVGMPDSQWPTDWGIPTENSRLEGQDMDALFPLAPPAPGSDYVSSPPWQGDAEQAAETQESAPAQYAQAAMPAPDGLSPTVSDAGGGAQMMGQTPAQMQSATPAYVQQIMDMFTNSQQIEMEHADRASIARRFRQFGLAKESEEFAAQERRNRQDMANKLLDFENQEAARRAQEARDKAAAEVAAEKEAWRRTYEEKRLQVAAAKANRPKSAGKPDYHDSDKNDDAQKRIQTRYDTAVKDKDAAIERLRKLNLSNNMLKEKRVSLKKLTEKKSKPQRANVDAIKTLKDEIVGLEKELGGNTGESIKNAERELSTKQTALTAAIEEARNHRDKSDWFQNWVDQNDGRWVSREKWFRKKQGASPPPPPPASGTGGAEKASEVIGDIIRLYPNGITREQLKEYYKSHGLNTTAVPLQMIGPHINVVR